ncbi:MAG: hypothetical protein ACOYL6_07575 [Bacteriovoracaceae bacterium]
MIPERLSENPNEILGVFQETQKKKHYILLWQKVDGKRLMIEAIVKKIQKDQGAVILEPKDPSIKLKDKEPIYGKGEVRNLLFKETLNFSSSQMIIFPIPKDVRLDELRQEQRHDFTNGEKVIFLSEHKMSQKQDLHERVLGDFSKSGLSFTTELIHINNLNVGDKISIAQIGNLSFEPRIEGQITYILPLQQIAIGKKTFYRVGVKFLDQKLDISSQ